MSTTRPRQSQRNRRHAIQRINDINLERAERAGRHMPDYLEQIRHEQLIQRVMEATGCSRPIAEMYIRNHKNAPSTAATVTER